MYTGDQARFYAPIATLCPNASVTLDTDHTITEERDAVFCFQYGIAIDVAEINAVPWESEAAKLAVAVHECAHMAPVLHLGRHQPVVKGLVAMEKRSAEVFVADNNPDPNVPTPPNSPTGRRSSTPPTAPPPATPGARCAPTAATATRPRSPRQGCSGRTSSTDRDTGPVGKTGAVPDFRCSFASVEDAEPIIGTAPTDPEILLVECPGPWGREAVTDNRLPEAVRDHLGGLDLKVFLLRAGTTAAPAPAPASSTRPPPPTATTSAARCSTGRRTWSTSTSRA